jgi:predicted neutral ceramidase superfamily lipid hydrolase
MKTSKILLETVLPISIGTLILVGYFFFSQSFPEETKIESCERYDISISVYFTYFIVIITLTSLYQILLGNRILKRNKNSFILNTVNNIVFATFFTGVLVLINLFHTEKKIEWEFFIIIFLAIFLLGIFYAFLIKLFGKIMRKRTEN